MARLKKGSRPLAKAEIRLASLKSIDAGLDLDNGLTILRYETAINDLQNRLQYYNTTLSLVDEQLNLVLESERLLMELSELMLIGVANKYSKNSIEYEKAGGVPKSKWKNKTRKTLRVISRNDAAPLHDQVAPASTGIAS